MAEILQVTGPLKREEAKEKARATREKNKRDKAQKENRSKEKNLLQEPDEPLGEDVIMAV